MILGSREHYELMEHFEREHKGEARLDRESKDQWPRGNFYQHGQANALFLSYRRGYALGKAVGVSEGGEG